MSTNYFWRHNICDCCGRYDELHICKSMVSFQGRFHEAEWDETTSQYAPPAVLVASWADWKRLISGDGQIWDEYGTQRQVAEFIASVEATDPAARRRQYEWCAGHPETVDRADIGRIGPRGNWLDAEGFSFYGGEFS